MNLPCIYILSLVRTEKYSVNVIQYDIDYSENFGYWQ